MKEIKRTFDILSYCETHFNHETALAIKRNGTWEKISTKTYRDQVDTVSRGLIAMGMKKGDKIATVLRNGPEWNFIDFGMSQIGCVHVSIYPTISDTEYAHILAHSDATVLIIDHEDLYQRIQPIVAKFDNIKKIYTLEKIDGVAHWSEILDKGKKATDLQDKLEQMRDQVTPDDLLTLIYTSGTTGLSKGVMLSHNNVVSNIKIAQTLVAYLNPGDRALSFLPLCHILERVGNYLWQYQGLVVYYPESMDTLGENMKEISVNTFITVPRVFEKVYDKIINKGRTLGLIKKMIFFWAVRVGNKFKPNPADRSVFYNFKLSIANKLVFSKWREALGGELKGVISGGAALQPRLARVFWAAGIIVQEGYGLTETSPLITGNNYEYPGVNFGSVGFVPKGIEVKIAEDGEILARGENIMLGYYKDEAKTKEVIDSDGWFHTGDIGHLDEEGLLYITDRKREIFKLSVGKYVAPQVVENKMKESQFIDQVLVIGNNRKFTSAIIVPDFHFLHNWCFLHNVFFHDNKDLIKKSKIIQRFVREIERLNEDLGQVEKIKKFRLVKEEWSVENSLLSPTQKVRREKIANLYQGLIEEIYAV